VEGFAVTRRIILFAPLGLLLLFAITVAWRLSNPPETTIRSQLEGKPVPAFRLPPAAPGNPALASTDLVDGQPKLLNIFASWCVPCIAEAPLLLELQSRGVIIDAIAIRDRPEDVAAFLARHGNPFTRIGSDTDSRVQLALGSSGVPESFVVDGEGIIRFQHVGPIESKDIPVLLAELEKAR
jgi:cytochrome c biogenesis protein CcmG/thiol:disulfide interchange protein DsbE